MEDLDSGVGFVLGVSRFAFGDEWIDYLSQPHSHQDNTLKAGEALLDRYTGKALNLIGGAVASRILGSRRNQLKPPKYQNPRHAPRIYKNGRILSGHAQDQMQDRGILEIVVDHVLSRGLEYRVGYKSVYYDPVNNVHVIVNRLNNTIITVGYGRTAL